MLESIRCCVKDYPIEVSILVIEAKHLLIIGGSYQVGYVLLLVQYRTGTWYVSSIVE